MMHKKTIAVISYITIIGWIIAYREYEKGAKSSLVKFHLEQSFGLAVIVVLTNIIMIIPVFFDSFFILLLILFTKILYFFYRTPCINFLIIGDITKDIKATAKVLNFDFQQMGLTEKPFLLRASLAMDAACVFALSPT